MLNNAVVVMKLDKEGKEKIYVRFERDILRCLVIVLVECTFPDYTVQPKDVKDAQQGEEKIGGLGCGLELVICF